MREVTLTRGMTALVDDADYERVVRHKWYASCHRGRWCAQRIAGSRGKRVCVKMHRFIVDAPEGAFVDHINGNALDNRRSNLRLASHAENQRNQGRRTNGSSRFKGVALEARALRKRWRAEIVLDRKKIFVGRFATEVEAARAYDAAARHLHGRFARTNFPVQRCRVCSCIEEDACKGGCSWVEPDLCSNCA